MVFDIHRKVFDEEDGEYREEEGLKYREDLMALFAQSSEGQALLGQDRDLWWADLMLDFGINYIGVTPPQMTLHDLNEILYDLFPRKVSTEAEKAPEIIHVMRAFWTFLKREFELKNANVLLRTLDDKAAVKLEQELDNPANYGIAKSAIMMGMARGFDMTTEEGIGAWMATYNAELAAGTGPRIPLPGESGPDAAVARGKMRSAMRKKKRKRKLANKSRKRNRKKM